MIALFIVPSLLIAVTGFVVRAVYEEGSAADRDTDRPDWIPTAVAERVFALIARDPDAILDPMQLNAITADFPYLTAQLVDQPAQSPSSDTAAHGSFMIPVRTSDGRTRSIAIGLRSRGNRGSGGPGDAIPLAGIAAIGVLIAMIAIVSRLLARSLVVPLQSLSDWAHALGTGDLSQTLQPAGDEEVQRVMHSLETMRTQLLISMERQAAAERSRMELIAALSHDLRTPITAIRGYAEGLRDGIATDTEQQRRYVSVIHERAVVLEHLISDLFRYTHVTAGSLTLERTIVDVAELATACATGMSELTITVTGAASVLADPTHLGRVFTNIYANAARYAAGSPVAVEISNLADGRVEIAVSDSGPGVTADSLEKLFTPGYRGDNSRNQQIPGSGLGLSIVQSIVTAHNGSVHARASQPDGTGLTIVVILDGAPS